MESAIVSSNLRLVKANELASFNFNIFKEFNAQVRRLGQISHNRDLGLSLFGLEGEKDSADNLLEIDKDNTVLDSADDQLEIDRDNTVLDRQLINTREPDIDHQLGA